jgi:hypothetical protein
MEPDCGYLYTVILMRIYEVGGPIADDEQVLSRRTGLPSRKLAAALAWLINHGKVQRLESGLLDSSTTHAEIEARARLIYSTFKAGKASAKRRLEIGSQKGQQKQQNASTSVEHSLNVGATSAQRVSTDIDIEVDRAPTEPLSDPNGSLVGETKRLARAKAPSHINGEVFQAVASEWNLFAVSLGLPQIDDLTTGRQGAIRERVRDLAEIYGHDDPLEGFRQLFARIRASPFLRGEGSSRDGKRPWRCNFDFATTKKSFTRIMEKTYES